MAEAKSKVEYTPVTMSDARVVQFPGKRKVSKDTLIDKSKVVENGDGSVTILPGAVKVRMDFLSGDTRTLDIPMALIAEFAGHGGSQKFGDELATKANEPMTLEDMVIAIDNLNETIQKGQWARVRAGGSGGGAGAGVVIRALMEVTGKDRDFVKAWIEKQLADNAELTRAALYKSFRNPGSMTGKVVRRMEDEAAAKESGIDADKLVGEISA